ncbi:MAG: SpoIIE family protein phosphatase [Anaerovoracaceae bacterium]|jgi:stage II sporulation protein E
MEIFVDNLRNALLKGNLSLERLSLLIGDRLALRIVVTAFLAFLMGRAGILHPGISCSLALMTVLMARGKGNIYALPLVVLGMISATGTGYGFWGEAVTLSSCTLLFFTLSKKEISLTCRALISGVLSIGLKTVFYYWTGRLFLYDGLSIAMEMLLLFTFIYVFFSFYKMLEGGEDSEKGEAEAIAVISIVLMLISTSIRIAFIPFSFTSFMGLLVPLCAGYRRGPMQGGLAGMIGGALMLVAIGSSPDLIGIFGFSGVVAGLFQKRSRTLASFCFAAIAVVFGLLKGIPSLYFSVYEPLLAALIFALAPSGVVEGLCAIVPISKGKDEGEWTEKRKVRRILAGYRDVFEKLALCCGNPNYSSPAKDVMALQFKGLTKTLDSIIENVSNPMKPAKKRKPRYKIKIGVSSFAKDQDVSGDSYLCEFLGEEDYLIVLSDGMGKGRRAAEESTTTVNTLRDLLKAGFDVEIALRIINSILLFKSADEIFSTVDMGLFNPHTGRMKLFKIGAATTYIKRDEQIRTIKIPALPMGIIEKISIESVEIKVRKGDAIVIVSDGIVDAAGGEGDSEWLEDAIRSIRSKDPQTMADLIINKAIEQYGLKERDDMTVIVSMVS